MPLPSSWTKIFCLTVACCALFACGKSNDKAPALGSSNKHPDGWLIAHRSAYSKNSASCAECHGADLKGGITKVDCFNQGALGSCHASGHGPRNVPHPIPYKEGALHGAEAKKDLVYCQSCHGTIGGPGSSPPPRFNISIGTLKNGCEDCHKKYTAHPPASGATTGWIGHATALGMGNNCTLCHGIDLTGSPATGAIPAIPGCNSCHTGLVPGTIPTSGSCGSCHARPPVTGSHTVHNALAGVAGVCNTCHEGAGSGTDKHGNGIKDVAVSATYNAKTGSATISGGRCSNISCHGGVTTPVWGGAFANDCLSCHTVGTAPNDPQFNSFYSGKHSKHIDDIGLQCTDCHDMSTAVGHFSSLSTTTTFELDPSATIRAPLNYVKATQSCSPGRTPTSGAFSVGVCHGTFTWN
jgi:predicted CxxxxCH...CXXCH cytochrome family protein